ncbi:MAG: two-component system LytT family sensor kinase [Crocinitomix sp.]|jgi:two-component system LytT family sensor kinase
MKFLYRKSIRLHLILWICYFLFLATTFAGNLDFMSGAYKAFQLIGFHILLFYINSDFLMPRYLEKRKFILYGLAILLGLILFSFLFHVFGIFDRQFDSTARNGLERPFIAEGFRRFKSGEGGLLFFLRFGIRSLFYMIIILLLSVVYRLIFQKFSNEKRVVQLRNEQLNTEMKFLKSQINPHFLFNTLNNIYTLTMVKHERAPEMIMRLSEILRYILYECNDEEVLLQREISFIRNYINLQQLKTNGGQNISIEFNEVDVNVSIAPLLLIPFIENSFKHSKVEDLDHGWVKIRLTVKKSLIEFNISNSIPKQSIVKDKHGGIGLENVGKRLQLIYPKKHNLYINETKDRFIVNLIIEK